MKLAVDVTFRFADDALQALKSIEAKIDQLITKGVAMAAELDALQAEVERNTSVDESAVALLEGVAAQIEALKQDPAKLQGLANSLRASSDALAAAVAANTVAAT